MDEPLDVTSQGLERHISAWLNSFDRPSARHGATLHTIISTLERYIGKTVELRRKSRDQAMGTRTQLPTVRRLPTRRRGIEHAWTSGLITDDEYRAATGDFTLAVAERHSHSLRDSFRVRRLSIVKRHENADQLTLPLFGREGESGQGSLSIEDFFR